MNSKITTNPQLPTTEPKTQKQKLSKQLEQEQNHKNGHHMKGTGIRIIISRHEIDRGRLRIVYEMEKPRKSYVEPMDIN